MKFAAFSVAVSTLCSASLLAEDAVDFAKDIAPILAEHCVKCHGPEKQKGKYRIDGKADAFKGGKSEKAAITAGDPEKSEVISRIFLAKDSDDLMPPEGGPLADELRGKLKMWVKAGAVWPDDMVVKVAATTGAAPAASAPAATPAPARPIPPLPELPKDFKPAAAEAAAAKALAAAGVEPRPIAQNVPWTEANFRLKGAEVTDAVIAPVKDVGSLVELRLGNTKVSDAGLKNVAALKHLQVLGLELTGITDAGLAEIKGLENLVYLNLYGTKVTDSGLDQLTGLKHLRNLYLWQTSVTPEGVKKLQAALPGVDINTGWVAPPVEKKDEAKKEEKK
jgi:hypothetical protein